jgi:hypothetical protein
MQLKPLAIFKPHPNDIDKVSVFVPCVDCGKPHSFDLPEVDWFTGILSLSQGKPIQQAFPNLNPDNREALISGLCPSCSDSIAGD